MRSTAVGWALLGFVLVSAVVVVVGLALTFAETATQLFGGRL